MTTVNPLQIRVSVRRRRSSAALSERSVGTPFFTSVQPEARHD
ncbi:hypothetical protein [Pseudomonas putida]|nr:hypothetical protein [Pseudomonas putida]